MLKSSSNNISIENLSFRCTDTFWHVIYPPHRELNWEYERTS